MTMSETTTSKTREDPSNDRTSDGNMKNNGITKSTNTIVHDLLDPETHQELRQQRFIQASESTRMQRRTEMECQPYFVNLQTLPGSQIQHLRDTGLLSPYLDNPYDVGEENVAAARRDGHVDDDNSNNNDDDSSSLQVCLLRNKHVRFLQQVWQLPVLKTSFTALDASRSWMMYWTLHGCDLLNVSLDMETCQALSTTLQSFFTVQPVSILNTVVQCDSLLSHLATLTVSNAATTSSSGWITFPHAGGFGGGPGQVPHAATTYAAVLALCIVACRQQELMTDDIPKPPAPPEEPATGANDEEPTRIRNGTVDAMQFLEQIRYPLYCWMASLYSIQTGSFSMHLDGEVDVRATYCLTAIASLLGLLLPLPSDSSNSSAMTIFRRDRTAHFVASCQTFEGGFGGEPWSEAHGGYTFCAVAALQLLHRFAPTPSSTCQQKQCLQPHLASINQSALLGWLVRRQMHFEGGFQGRTNKLVDGCYSFWQGGALAIASRVLHATSSPDSTSIVMTNVHHDLWLDNNDDDNGQKGVSGMESTTSTLPTESLLFDQGMLQRYILLCAQDIAGGLRDKPSQARDFYHSCYNLSGLSVSQNHHPMNENHCLRQLADLDPVAAVNGDGWFVVTPPDYGHKQYSIVAPTHPCYNLRMDRARSIRNHFHQFMQESMICFQGQSQQSSA